MQETQFEKQVRDKMDQLHFDPEEHVWSAIDAQINKKEKRRLPTLWIYLVGGMLFCAGLYYWYSNEKISNQHADALIKSAPITATQAPLSENQNENNIASDTIGENRINNTTPALSFQNSENLSQIKREKIISAPYPVQNSAVRNHDKDVSVLDQEANAATANHVTELATTVPGNQNTLTKKTDKVSGTASDNKISKKEPENESVAKNQKSSKNKSVWKFGLRTDVGISNTLQYAYNNTLLYNAPTPNGGYYINNDPGIGFSFGAGFFFERTLKKRISVSAGLNYHYYSSHVQTGNYSNNSITVPSYNGTVNGYYANGNQLSFTNQYHFLELPLTFGYTLNAHKMPMYIEPSLSLAYLISSNALYYEPSGNVYVKNSQAIQHTQFNGGIAFLFGFNLEKSQFRVGPMLQYGFTSLIKSDYGNPEHLIYGGLKIVFIPKRNNTK